MRCDYIVVLCLLAFSIHAGSGLKCWICTSSQNHHCGDPFNSTFFDLQECHRGYSQINSACKKLKQSVSENGPERVTRECVYDKDNACFPSSAHSSLKDVFCETCSGDGCNSAHSVTPATLTALLPATLWAVATKIL